MTILISASISVWQLGNDHRADPLVRGLRLGENRFNDGATVLYGETYKSHLVITTGYAM